MNITIFGTGYVGLVSATCFADEGNNVVCVDIDKERVEKLNSGYIPIYEPGLEELIERNTKAKRLSFTTDTEVGVRHGDVLFIAVGTPEKEDGSAELQYVFEVARSIGLYLNDYKVIVDKSTVPVGTGAKVREIISDTLQERGVTYDYDVVSNPEFLKEGNAIYDFTKPDRVVIGCESDRSAKIMRNLYSPFLRSRDRIVTMDIESAELTKYAANVMLATKVSLMNELSNLADATGADIEMVRKGIGSDHRIGYHFIYPGCGFGGSCFPKDVAALTNTAKKLKIKTPIMDGVLSVNSNQKKILQRKIEAHFGDVTGKTFALWGLAFKPNTDDMREAPSRVVMEYLWENGATVRAFDPEANKSAQDIYGRRDDFQLCEEPMETLDNADALIVVTEWNIFRNPDFNEVKSRLNSPTVFDGRNIYDPQHLESLGITYYGIGRGSKTS